MAGETINLSPIGGKLLRSFEEQTSRLAEKLNARRDKENSFKENYGEGLYTYSDAYVNRARISSLLTEVDYPNFASLILAHIKSQPVDQREEWLAGYLKNLEGLRRR